MIRNFTGNFVLVTGAPLSFWGKVGAFFSVTRLFFKIRLFRQKNKEVSETFHGMKVYAYNYQALDFLYKEIFIRNDYTFKTENKKPVIIDCGANIGMSVLYFKKQFPGAHILAFEANPSTYHLLKKNIETNRSADVALYNVALYDKEEEIPFFTGEEMGTVIGSVQQSRGGKNSVMVPAKKLSSYLNGHATIDLIKMDVEGAEINIIDDLIASNTLTKTEEYIIEYHHNIQGEQSKLSSFIEKFEQRGYNYNVKAEILNPKGYQDILIHFYKREKG